ncbi:MAG: hypothetical protein V7603_6771 [Micromonosporaceae bacterium]
MFAIAAAIVFAIAFILDIAETGSGRLFNAGTLTVLGLLLLALHLAPLGTMSTRRWRR